MQIKLQRWLFRKILILFTPLLLALMPVVCLGQTQLSPNDIAVTQVNSGSPVHFRFVPFVDLEEGTTVHFTDSNFDADSGTLSDDKNTLTYTAPATITAGAVISYEGTEDASFSGNSLRAGENGGHILVYQSTGADITFLWGIEWGKAADVWSSNSNIPPGLKKAEHSLVSLGSGANFWYDSRNPIRGTPQDLAEQIADEANWHASETTMPPANNLSFEVIQSAVIGFINDILTVAETDSSLTLTVELVEPGREDVSADVVFVSDQSTISGQSIGDYTTQKVQFTASDEAGTRESITLPVSDSDSYKGRQTAVFMLQNSSGGTVISSGTMKVLFDDRRAPDIVINEINASPGNDADGNGIKDNSDDEFIEFVNSERNEIDVSGWKFSDDGGATVRHIFPEGTVLPALGALVLFANEEVGPEGNFGGAVVQNSNQSVTLGLDDEGDLPTLIDSENNIVASYPYGPEAGDRQSITRSPDIRGEFIRHTKAAGSAKLLSSPGTYVNGSSFGSKFTITMGGREGWRMIAVPTQNTSFEDLFDSIRTQGVAGSDAPAEEASIYFWDEVSGGTLVSPGNLANEMTAGVGYMIYLFEDDNAGTPVVEGGFPKTVVSDKRENPGSVSVPVSATDANGNGEIDGSEGFNLLGNPFGSNISVSALLDALEKVDKSINRNVLVWDYTAGEGNGGFSMLTEGNQIAPFQAFFIRFTAEVNGTVVLNKKELQATKNRRVYAETDEESAGFEIRLNNGSYYDSYHMSFTTRGKLGPDVLDAYKLLSLNSESVSIYSREGTQRLGMNALPYDLDTPLEIPLMIDVPQDKEKFEFTWRGTEQIPEEWDLVLKDLELNREVDLRNGDRYEFTYAYEHRSVQAEDPSLLNVVSGGEDEEPRFVLSVNPNNNMASDKNGFPESVKLNPNYPNPFNSTTTIPFELASEAEVKLSIWNIVGQKVATLIDGIRDAGSDNVVWNAADMPSGIYIAQLEVEGIVYIRKMTLIKY